MDTPGDDCAPDGDVRIESVVVPGFPPATMRRRIEGHCATLTMSEGDRIGVFRARLDDATVQKIVDATPDAIDVKGMVPDMPVCAIDLKTPTRDVHLIVPLTAPAPKAAEVMTLSNAIDQTLLHRPYQTVRATTKVAPLRSNVAGVARVTLTNDGAVAVDVRVGSIHVLSAPLSTDTQGAGAAILLEAGTSGATTLHLDARGSTSVDVAVTMKKPCTQIALARIDLAFDIDAAKAVAPNGSHTIKAVIEARDFSVDVSP